MLQLLGVAQNYEMQGDELYKQAQYDKAIKKYKAAAELDDASPLISQKIQNANKCISLSNSVQMAEENESYERVVELYSQLYDLNALPLYKNKIVQYKGKIKDPEQKRSQREDGELLKGDEYIYSQTDALSIDGLTMPEFPGGQRVLFSYIRENIKYPAIAKEKGIQGRVICEFVVNKDGTIEDVVVRRSGGDSSLDEEAVRVIKSMPLWNPGRLKGNAVRVRYSTNVSFFLQSTR